MDHRTPSSLSNPWTISALNHMVAHRLEEQYRAIWVTGEISNLASARYGHRYFSLKDAKGQIACVWFLRQMAGSKVELKEGLQVVVRGTVSLYSPRGTYQLQVDRLEEAGSGALQQAFEALKKKLQALGWFDAEHKKSLPRYPQTIGVVTSPSAAAFQDILSVLNKRYPLAQVILYPCLVQGDGAPASVVQALQHASEHNKVDVLLLSRGGGSLEDLWAFNEEMVAKAVFECPIPIITGVGHEVDTTIVDWVADHRAPTPSAAAEKAVPDQQTLLQTLHLQERHLQKSMDQLLKKHRLHLELLKARCIHPQERLARMHYTLQKLWFTLRPIPQEKIQTLSKQVEQCHLRLISAGALMLQVRQTQLSALTHRLDGVSPLATLKRGYAKVAHKEDGKPIASYQDAKPGDAIAIALAEGKLLATIDQALADSENT